MKKENQYNTADLTRALVRQYLHQKGCKNTLNCFEREDPLNKKKISRTLLIQMTSMKNLCLINRSQPKSESTLLQVLVAYLNKKYQAKSNVLNKTQPQFYNRPLPQVVKKSQKVIQNAQYPNKNFQIKERPSTSKGSKKEQIQKPAQIYEKAQLKVIYDKITKIEEKAKTQQVSDRNFKVEPEKQVEQPVQEIKSKSTSKISDNLPSKLDSKSHFQEQEVFYKVKYDIRKEQSLKEVKDSAQSIEVVSAKTIPEQKSIEQARIIQFLEPEKKDCQSSKIQEPRPTQSIPNIEPVQIDIEEEYNQQFDTDLAENTIRPPKVQPPSLIQIDNQLVSRKAISSQHSRYVPSLPIIEQQLVSLKDNKKINEEDYSNQKVQIPNMTFTKSIDKQEQRVGEIRTTLAKQFEDEEINTLPVVHNLQSKVQVNQQSNQSVNHIKSPIMGGIIDSSKDEVKETPPETKQILKTDIAKLVQELPKQDIPSEQPPAKPRTQMRLIGKNRQSNKQLQSNKQIQKVEEKPQPVPEFNISSKKQEIKLPQKTEAPQQPKQPVMVAIGKKKKMKEESNNDANYPTKFKFDQNFSHGIQVQAIYDYEQYKVDSFVLEEKAQQKYPNIIIQTEINYKIKGGGLPPFKKKLQKSIATKDAQKLKTTVFQSSPPNLPKSWTQGFILSPHENTPYGLKQIEGGPCGIIAAVQCYYLKHLFLCAKDASMNNPIVRQVALVAGIADLLWKVKSSDKITLAFPPKGATKIDINNLRVVTFDAHNFNTAFSGVWASRDEFIGQKNFGVAALLYSAVLTKGTQKIEQQVDIKINPLIGNHGHCTQQFVNLVLTGRACSNVFDGQKVVDDYKIKGIPQKSQFGFLTVFQALKYIEVGKNLKNPIIPAWVICKQFHYHVIFASHHLISQNNKSPKFDIVYFDGLYNCGDKIRVTLSPMSQEEQEDLKVKELPLIEQVMMTKWGARRGNWNGSTKIL